MTKETIKRFIDEAHGNAIKKGFYDCPACKGVGVLSNVGIDSTFSECVCPECKGTKIDQSKNIGELLMLIVSELGEALEAHRCGKFATGHGFNSEFKIDKFNSSINNIDEIWVTLFKSDIKDTFEDEIADVFIRLFDLCGYLGIEPYIDHLCSEISIEINVAESFLTVTEFICYINNKDKTDPTPIKTELDIIFSSLSDFCERLNIPIQKHIEAKIAYNKTRPHKHGKDY